MEQSHSRKSASSQGGTASGRIELVLFDMDGVIFEGSNFWLELHREYGTATEGEALATQYLDDDYELLAREVAGRLWKGLPAGPYEALVDEREYEPGIGDVLSYLRERDVPTAIISSGPRQLAERVRAEWGVDEIRANYVEIKNGRVTGVADIMVPDGNKIGVGRDVMAHFGVAPSHVAFVGDSAADVGLVGLVGLGIAYNATSPDLIETADYVLERGGLRDLIEILAPRLAPTVHRPPIQSQ
jgi:phosphoserine phosphatase